MKKEKKIIAEGNAVKMDKDSRKRLNRAGREDAYRKEIQATGNKEKMKRKAV